MSARPVTQPSLSDEPTAVTPDTVRSAPRAVKRSTKKRPAKKGATKKGVAPTKGPTKAQKAWLARGLAQPGGKLPLFDHNGRRVSTRLVRACLDAGWAEPWFANPLKPDWHICKLTDAGRQVAGAA